MKTRFFLMTCVPLTLCAGCASSQFDHSAVQAILSITSETRQAVEEYQYDIASADNLFEELAIQTFINRIQNANGDADLQQQHATALQQAMQKIRDDRKTGLRRYMITMDNLALIDEVAGGLGAMSQKRAEFRETAENTFSDIISNYLTN